MKSNSVTATKARRGLGYKIRDSVGYLMRNEISLSLPSHQGTLGILSTDAIICCHIVASACVKDIQFIWTALCFSILHLWNTVCMSAMHDTELIGLSMICSSAL